MGAIKTGLYEELNVVVGLRLEAEDDDDGFVGAALSKQNMRPVLAVDDDRDSVLEDTGNVMAGVGASLIA